MGKKLQEKSIREMVWGALGMRPKRGWTASELDDYVSFRRDDYSYKSITATLATLQNQRLIRKMGKRPSEVTNNTSYAYTRV